MTRVLMTADTVGGVWTYALDLARALPECEFHVATMGALPSPGQVSEAAQVENVTLHESAYRLEWMPEPWDDVARAGEWLLELTGQVRPDVVHLNGFAHGTLPFGVPKVMVGHSCVLSWYRAVRGVDAPAEWGRYAEAVRVGVASSDYVVAPTGAMLSALAVHYGPLPPSRVIYNAREAALFGADGVERYAKEPFVLSAGRVWDEAKNIALLAEAAAGLPWAVRVAGNASVPGGDGAAADWPGVCLMGHLPPPEMAECMGRASVYALPARYEPFGLSVLEAALSGCALVLGDIASLREVWGDAALFVSPDDAGALHMALQMLCEDDMARYKWAGRARHRAGRYSPARMASGYRALYGECVQG